MMMPTSTTLALRRAQPAARGIVSRRSGRSFLSVGKSGMYLIIARGHYRTTPCSPDGPILLRSAQRRENALRLVNLAVKGRPERRRLAVRHGSQPRMKQKIVLYNP